MGSGCHAEGSLPLSAVGVTRGAQRCAGVATEGRVPRHAARRRPQHTRPCEMLPTRVPSALLVTGPRVRSDWSLSLRKGSGSRVRCCQDRTPGASAHTRGLVRSTCRVSLPRTAPPLRKGPWGTQWVCSRRGARPWEDLGCPCACRLRGERSATDQGLRPHLHGGRKGIPGEDCTGGPRHGQELRHWACGEFQGQIPPRP